MGDCSDDNLKFTVQTGVNHIVVAVHKPFIEEGQDYWTTEYRELIGVLSYWNNGYRC